MKMSFLSHIDTTKAEGNGRFSRIFCNRRTLGRYAVNQNLLARVGRCFTVEIEYPVDPFYRIFDGVLILTRKARTNLFRNQAWLPVTSKIFGVLTMTHGLECTCSLQGSTSTPAHLLCDRCFTLSELNMDTGASRQLPPVTLFV